MAPRSARVALVILTELSSLFYSGTVFGWAPMLLVLQREGLFSELCDESSPSPSEGGGWCDAQKEQLGLIFTWAAVVYSASGIVVGAFLDAAGPAWGVVAACATSVVGSYLFACSWAWASGWVVILGYSLIGVGGMCFFQCAFKAQYAFPRPNGGGFEKQTLIIAIATTFGDASVCMWLLFEWLYSNVGLSLDAIFKGYILFTVVLSAILGALWRLCGPDILALEPRDSDGDGEGDAPKSSSLSSSSGDSSYGAVPTSEPGAPSSASSFAAYKGGSLVLLKDRPFHDQLWTLEFLQMMVFQAVHTTRANLYLGLLAYFYESAQFIGATGDRTKFVNITSALVPLGCFCAPVVERLIDNLGFGWTAQVIALGGAAQSFIMLSSSLQLQYAAAAVFLVYRANVFAFPPTFAGQIFGPRTCGRITGMMYTLMAPVQFLLTPALTATLTTFHDSFRPLNVLELLALVPMVLITCLLQARSKEPAVRLPRRGDYFGGFGSRSSSRGSSRSGTPKLSYSPASLPVAHPPVREPPSSEGVGGGAGDGGMMDRRRRRSHDNLVGVAVELSASGAVPGFVASNV